MGKIKKQPRVKLITGLIFSQQGILDKAQKDLIRHFGKIDFESNALAFTHTDYYKKEFGSSLYRKFLSFQKLIDPAKLAEIKILTNKIEEKYKNPHDCRLINIDPGYLDFAKLILATTKDYAHRIYLKKGIYAEITLSYQDKQFKPLAWTYPDYRANEYSDIFNTIRDIYAGQRKN